MEEVAASRLVAIGASWGGVETLGILLARVPYRLAAAVVIVQHRMRDGDLQLLEVLSRSSVLPLHETEDKDPLLAGHAYLAPADYHLLIEPSTLTLSIDPKVNSARPSIDVLFETAAWSFGERAVGVLLTGLGHDGVVGLHAIRARGGTVLIEDPATAKSAALPRAALGFVEAHAVLPIEALADALGERVGVLSSPVVRSPSSTALARTR